MIANGKLSEVVSAACFLAFIAWLFLWSSIASDSSGKTTSVTEIDGKRTVQVTYDRRLGRQQSVPIVVAGVFGGIVGAIVSFRARQKPRADRWLRAVFLAPAIAVVLVLILLTIFAFLDPHAFSGDMSAPRRTAARVVVLLLYSFGVCIFSGIPSVLVAVATACFIGADSAKEPASGPSTSGAENRQRSKQS
jgi:H+/Cl- antiporter ClcA